MKRNRNGGRPEVADVFREALVNLKSGIKFSRDEVKVIRGIILCRTAALGGHINYCDECGGEVQSYNSCWNRHCPKCQGSVRFEWVSKREAELLDVSYHQVVFTLARELEEICYQNKRVCYDLQLKASARTLDEVARDRLGMRIGSIAVLHTWDQELKLHTHPHLNCVAISNSRIVSIKDKQVYFLVRDRRKKHKKRIHSLPVQEFMRRFLLHILPKKFRRIRYYGFMSNGNRKHALPLCRALISKHRKRPPPKPLPKKEKLHPQTCSLCGKGIMRLGAIIKPVRKLKKLWIRHVPVLDST